jgi:uracil-DNA glycosylase
MTKASRTKSAALKSAASTSAAAEPLSLRIINERVEACCKCPRLVRYRAHIGKTKRRAYADHEYWARGVPGFGDEGAELLIVGLAPGAHGSNRTGRPFTGDASGNFLYPALHRAGFASQATAVARGDGLELRNAYITAVARCAPPDNKPLPSELENCAVFLEEEFDVMRPRAVLALGRIAWTEFLRMLARREDIPRAGAYEFAHGAEFDLPNGLPRLFGSYHPSQQNTATGKLTAAMFDLVLRSIGGYLAKPRQRSIRSAAR